ncbi:DUF3592 domain-containing protein [Parafrankia elaeagni]|uniref:DUF3592 domain-containing protein n=1 Tax=Parafrankia elaeagni TaxID=222534 RepID=UPI0003645956|nr:DUF3592 domain-containing protein [Parafrankia elaeagni]
MSVEGKVAGGPGIGRTGYRKLSQRLAVADVIADHDDRDRRRTGVPERTIGALVNSVVWPIGETAVVTLAAVLVFWTVEGVAALIVIGAFVFVVRSGEQLRQQLRLARRAVVVEGVVESIRERRSAGSDRYLARIRYITARDVTRLCWMHVPLTTVGGRVSVRHDPWFPRRVAWGLSGRRLVFFVVVLRIGYWFVFCRRIVYHLISGLLFTGVLIGVVIVFDVLL